MNSAPNDPDFAAIRRLKREPRFQKYNPPVPGLTRNAANPTGFPENAATFAFKPDPSKVKPQEEIRSTPMTERTEFTFKQPLAPPQTRFPAAAWSNAAKERKNVTMKREAKKVPSKPRRSTSRGEIPKGLIRKKFVELQQKQSVIEEAPTESQLSVGEIESYVAELKNLYGRVCKDYQAKYFLLKDRDTIMNKARPRDLNKVMKGTMREMCSEKERYSRMMGRAASVYERSPDEFVKEYVRSAADQDLPLPHELRPIDTLILTTDHLMSDIADNVPEDVLELVKWYEFIWSRTRAIRKDITQQRLVNTDVVSIIEKCIRFHIFAGYKLSVLEAGNFDPRMNIENLAKCLQSLRHCYEDLAKKDIFCPNEPEFRSYDILLNMLDSGVASQANHYRSDVKKNPLVQNALAIASAFHCEEYRLIFKLVEADSTTFLQACLCHQNFTQIRAHLLIHMSEAMSKRLTIEASFLVKMLFFESLNACLDFLAAHGCEITQDINGQAMVDIQKFRMNSGFIDNYSPLVDNKLKTSIATVICGAPPKKVRPPKAINSFDEEDRYANDPVISNFIYALTGEHFAWVAKPMDKDFFSKKSTEFQKPSVTPLMDFTRKPQMPSTSTLLPPPTFTAAKSSIIGKSLENSPFGGFNEPAKTPVSFSFGKPSDSTPFSFKKSEDDEKKRLAEEEEMRKKQEEELRAKEEAEKKKREEEARRLKQLQEEAEKRKKEAEFAEQKRKLQEQEILKKKVSGILVDEVLTKVVRNKSLALVKEEITKFKKVQKERKKVVKRLAENLVTEVIFDSLVPIAEKVCNQLRSRWDRLAEIGNSLHQRRIEDRTRRYVNHWIKFTKWKREKKAIETFKDAVRNASDDKIKKIQRLAVCTKPISEIDVIRSKVMTIRKWRAERLARKYFSIWRAAAPRKKAYRLWREEFVSIPVKDPGQVIIGNYWKRREVKKLPLFRKRYIREEPSEIESPKRFRFSTPFDGLKPRTPLFCLSPVSRRI